MLFSLRIKFFLLIAFIGFGGTTAGASLAQSDLLEQEWITVIVRDRAIAEQSLTLRSEQVKLDAKMRRMKSRSSSLDTGRLSNEDQSEFFDTQNRIHRNKAKIKQVRDSVNTKLLQKLPRLKKSGLGNRQFRNPALRTFKVTAAEYEALKADPEMDVMPNFWMRPQLSQSVPLVFNNQTTAGFDGTGSKVALLDTGVNIGHSFLSGAVANSVGACFSTIEAPFVTSLCPNSTIEQIGSGAGVNCSSAIDGCAHGTQMAGIIAGSDASQSGVAVGAEVVPIQIYSQINSNDLCGGPGTAPCILSSGDDLIRALEYVQTIALSQGISAVNISGGRFVRDPMTNMIVNGVCDANLTPLKAEIDALVNLGVAVIASSGNDSENLALHAPACLSSVVAVASTNKAASPAVAVPTTTNNATAELDFFAPGESVSTSTLVPVNGIAAASGTSASAAHVSGAWAVLKSKNPRASVAQIKSVLTSTGTNLTQPGTAFTKPLINVGAALQQLPSPPPASDELCVPVRASNGAIALICL